MDRLTRILTCFLLLAILTVQLLILQRMPKRRTNGIPQVEVTGSVALDNTPLEVTGSVKVENDLDVTVLNEPLDVTVQH